MLQKDLRAVTFSIALAITLAVAFGILGDASHSALADSFAEYGTNDHADSQIQGRNNAPTNHHHGESAVASGN